MNILEAKAARSLKKYGVDIVCANVLGTHRSVVTLISRDLQNNTVPETRDKRRGINDVMDKMGNHNDKYTNRSLTHHHSQGNNVALELNHINKK